jgi:hypothetical protein
VVESTRHLRFASFHAYIAAMDLKFWKKALHEAERELDAATTCTALDAAAKKLMRPRPGYRSRPSLSSVELVAAGGHRTGKALAIR